MAFGAVVYFVRGDWLVGGTLIVLGVALAILSAFFHDAGGRFTSRVLEVWFGREDERGRQS